MINLQIKVTLNMPEEDKIEEMKKKALNLAQRKSVREQKDLWVYRDEDNPEDYYISPHKINDSEKNIKLIKFFSSETSIENSEQLIEINSPEDQINEGDEILIDGKFPEQVVQVSERQIITHSGNKFRRSDGKEWGTPHAGSSDSSELTHKVI